MAHDHHHGAVGAAAGDRRMTLAVAVNLLLTVAQIVGGVLSGSLALIADAMHNLSDALSLGIAFAARRIARRPADARMTFGYARVEVVAALINYTTLIVVGLYLAGEAVMRLFDPQPVTGWLVVAVAGLALAVDTVTALLTWKMAKDSVNIRAAFLHNVADALGSVAVIVAGTLILLYDWRLADPLVTLGIAGYILWMAATEIGGVIRILMLGSPPDTQTAAVLDTVRATDGVAGVHNAHFWQLDERRNSVQVHVVIARGHWQRADGIKDAIRQRLNTEHGIRHATIEIECATHACTEAPVYGS